MCGINGYILLENNFSEQKKNGLMLALNKMNDLIIHRGPDSEGVFFKENVGFGFRRLSIIDLSNHADQPMVKNDLGLAIVFNGEIYNYLEVKKDLIDKGHVFNTDSDTEVILNAYKEYGEECVHYFNGMWAFAIYDYQTKKVFCSRDRFGVKPFYYCIKDNVLFFSSELKALHSVCDLKNANLAKVYEYLAYGYRVNDGETFFEGCNELLPGTKLIVKNNKIEINRYWELKENQYQHDPSLTYEQEYRRLFEDAIKIRYRSDVPVAILLSGGLDSTAISKVTDQLIENGGLNQTDIHAYTASFPDFEENETETVRGFIKTCKNIKLHEMEIDQNDLVSSFEKTLSELDHPLGSFASIAHNNIMKLCKERGIKVVLNGQGSDEAYAGYSRYIAGVFLVDVLISKPKTFLSEFRSLNTLNGFSKLFLVSQMFKAIINQSTASFLRAKYQEKSISVLKKNFVEANRKHFKNPYKFSAKEGSFQRYLLHQINNSGINQILHYEDVSAMNQSIEIRSPFMDYRLMEFAFSIPIEYKFSKGVTKKIQRDTIGKDLPKGIVNDRNKIGFKTPFLDYLKSDEKFKSYVSSILNSDSFNSKHIWDAEKIRRQFNNIESNESFPYWRILNLEVWAKSYNISNL
ncbi:asparagine synthase (glutamine-hydrolyzing) [Belliella sp. DSM 107340]|uniref:asparagine synthase (glutamine-hydrolyzing) n=1 Tax=Belliella calami TaxID=2923436 RepID=A0ABS9UQ92_9BACT|nr:asparagine synthase (glutamine-hydrolyzing) [Belliella calami]MCH7398629.1 asparagine synthase (glutamine-hydrolyzing) [Belliella calami]